MPPLRQSVKKNIDKKNNPFFTEGGECDLFLVRQSHSPHKVVGRFAISHSPRYVNKWGTKTVFFGFYEQIDCEPLARFIYTYAANHARTIYKAEEMIGPVNLTTNYQVGMLLDAFEEFPIIEMLYNPPYYPRFFESSPMWEKAMDAYAYHMTIESPIVEKVFRVSERLRKRYNITIRKFDVKHEKRDLKTIYDIYNDAWSNNWGFTPFSETEYMYVSSDLKKIAVPDILLIGYINDEPCGFSAALPDLNQIFKTIPHGRLTPVAIFKLLTQIRKLSHCRVLTTGIKKKFQHLGLSSIFFLETLFRGRKNGIFSAELSWVLECNKQMVRAATLLGAKKSKTYRIYRASLTKGH